MKAVIITDLDGTLIDHDTYSAAPASDAIERAKKAAIPVCICSSKTRREILHYRKILGITDPFISENGGAIFIPNFYFDVIADRPSEESFEKTEFGTSYSALVAALREVRNSTRVRIRGFHELTPEQLSKKAGLTLHLAELALDREYDEPFWIEDGGPGDFERAVRALQDRSLNVTRGSRFHHVMGDNDKGRAVAFLSQQFRRRFPGVVFAGLGDSPNDIPMLRQVDIPILVKSPSGTYDNETCREVSNLLLADGIGPAGWNSAVGALLSEWMP